MIPQDILPVSASPEDSRDHIASVPVGAVLPERAWIPLFERDYQEDIGSCVMHTATAAIEALLLAQGKPVSLSRMYAHVFIRLLSITYKRDKAVGAYPRDMGRALSKFGIVPETLWPYDPANLYTLPPIDVVAEGLKNADWQYERIPTPGVYDGVEQFTACNTAIKSFIARGIPVCATLELDEEFTARCSDPDWRKHDWLVRPKPGAKVVGGHEVLFHAYDDRPAVKRVRFQNWWRNWGDQPDAEFGGFGGGGGLMYQPKKGQLWQSRRLQELWVIHPK